LSVGLQMSQGCLNKLKHTALLLVATGSRSLSQKLPYLWMPVQVWHDHTQVVGDIGIGERLSGLTKDPDGLLYPSEHGRFTLNWLFQERRGELPEVFPDERVLSEEAALSIENAANFCQVDRPSLSLQLFDNLSDAFQQGLLPLLLGQGSNLGQLRLWSPDNDETSLWKSPVSWRKVTLSMGRFSTWSWMMVVCRLATNSISRVGWHAGKGSKTSSSLRKSCLRETPMKSA
jgi:hypothetical protein